MAMNQQRELEQQLEACQKQLNELRKGYYSTTAPDTITVNLKYHNDLISDLSTAKAENERYRKALNDINEASNKVEAFELIIIADAALSHGEAK
jgi:hypothetical protein